MQRGILSADDNEYFLIQPLPRRLQQSNQDQPHIIVRRPASYLSKYAENNLEPSKSLCPHGNGNNLHPSKKYWSKHRRKKYPEGNLDADDWQKENETETDEDWKKEGINLTEDNGRRKKRAVHLLGSPVFVETAVFVDRDLFQHMRANYPIDTERELVRFVLAMINAVSICFKKYLLFNNLKLPNH